MPVSSIYTGKLVDIISFVSLKAYWMRKILISLHNQGFSFKINIK